MQIIPLIYLKSGKAAHPVGARPAWFQENPLDLARTFSQQGAESLYVNDLNVPTTGKGENLPGIQAIQQNLKLKLWVTGNFRTLTAMEPYIELGIEKIVLGGAAYQEPNLVKEATRKFPQKIAVLIEVKNKRVVIPGMVAPSHKTSLDYATQFEEKGVAAFCYQDEDFIAVKEFCVHTKIPVIALSEIQTMPDLQKLFDCETAGLIGVVVGKPLYENRIDLHSGIAFLNDLAAATTKETTMP